MATQDQRYRVTGRNHPLRMHSGYDGWIRWALLCGHPVHELDRVPVAATPSRPVRIRITPDAQTGDLYGHRTVEDDGPPTSHQADGPAIVVIARCEDIGSTDAEPEREE